jgi:hypothetical protein
LKQDKHSSVKKKAVFVNFVAIQQKESSGWLISAPINFFINGLPSQNLFKKQQSFRKQSKIITTL